MDQAANAFEYWLAAGNIWIAYNKTHLELNQMHKCAITADSNGGSTEALPIL